MAPCWHHRRARRRGPCAARRAAERLGLSARDGTARFASPGHSPILMLDGGAVRACTSPRRSATTPAGACLDGGITTRTPMGPSSSRPMPICLVSGHAESRIPPPPAPARRLLIVPLRCPAVSVRRPSRRTDAFQASTTRITATRMPASLFGGGRSGSDRGRDSVLIRRTAISPHRIPPRITTAQGRLGHVPRSVWPRSSGDRRMDPIRAAAKRPSCVRWRRPSGALPQSRCRGCDQA